MPRDPIDEIKQELSKFLSENKLKLLPKKWEKLGDVAIIKIPPELKNQSNILGKIYADVLGCKTILNDIGGISGELRKPEVEIIYGSKNTETIHTENKVRFKLDPQKVMFSSGNMNERGRMGTISNSNETVVDLFAGIGYFTLPMAVHSRPGKIYAIEKNPVSFDYLCQNIPLNNVSSIVEPIHGDNRMVAPKNVANRVIMGFFGDTHQFLPVAFECLKNNCGVIHYHDKFPEESIPDKPVNVVRGIAEKYNRTVDLIDYKHVKSYAPGISHYVFDIRVDEK